MTTTETAPSFEMWLIKSTDHHGAFVLRKSSVFKRCAISKIDIFAKQAWQTIPLLGKVSFSTVKGVVRDFIHGSQAIPRAQYTP